MKRFSLTLAGYLLSLTLLILPSHAYAASATMYLSPGSSSVANGNYLTVYIYENSGGTTINSVQANLKYTSSLLQFISIGSSSTFSVAAQSSGGGGSVKIARGALPAVSGTHLVASVTFKALASSGRASVSISSGSAVVAAKGNKNILTSSSGGSYSLTKPAPAPKKDTKPPAITDVAVSGITTSSATVTWKTSEPATSEVDYGINDHYGLSASSSKRVTSHKMVLKSPLITAATEYHYRIKSADAAGNKTTTKDATFRTTGTTLQVTILGKGDGKPLAGAKVTLNGQTVTTDNKGQATFTDLPAGSLTGTVVYKGVTSAISVTVNGTSTGQPQLTSFKVATPASGSLAVPVIIVVVLIGIVAAWWFTRGKIGSKFGKFGRKGGSDDGGSGPVPPPAAPDSSAPEPTVITPQNQ